MSKKINICFVIDNLFERGGTEYQVIMLIEHLDRSRFEPFLVMTNGDAETSMAPKNCPVLYYDVKKIFSIHGLKTAIKFRRFLKENKIDMIQTYFPDATFFASIVGKLSGVPVVFGARRNIGHWMRPKDKWAAKFLNRFFIDKIIANAQACKRTVIEQENAKPENVIIIPNGIETPRYESIPTWTSDRTADNANSPCRIGAVGAIKPIKGTDVLINAAKIVLKKYPQVQFQVAGSGDFEFYQKQIDTLGIAEHFQLLGSLTDVPHFLSTLDIAVLPSRGEGLSNALLEYMAAGRPAIATDVGGNGELMTHDKNGLLVPSENVEALAGAILQLLDEPHKAELFAKEARKTVQNQYDADIIADQFCNVCEKAIEATRQRQPD